MTAPQPGAAGLAKVRSRGKSCWVRGRLHEVIWLLRNVFFIVVFSIITILVAYPVLSADPGWRMEADNREKGCDLQPTDEQLLICDQVSRQRATCRWRERNGQRQKLRHISWTVKNWYCIHSLAFEIDLFKKHACELGDFGEAESPIFMCTVYFLAFLPLLERRVQHEVGRETGDDTQQRSRVGVKPAAAEART